MIKIVNFRSIFFLFLISLVCIYVSFMAITSAYYLFGLIVPIIWFLILVFKKKFVLLTVSVLFLSFLSCYTFSFIKNYSNNIVENQSITIKARIDDINKMSDNFSYLTLSNIEVINNTEIDDVVDGKISIVVNNYENIFIDIGYFITFESQLIAVKPINANGEINSFYIKNNIRYESLKTINLSNAILTVGEKNLNERFKEHNKQILISNLGEDDGNIALAVLFGGTNNLDENLLEVFKTSGVMHIFSVSGLHISLLVTLIYFVLKKLKLKDKANFVISVIILFFFCYLCSFSAPVLRSTIMTLVVLFAKVVFRKNDPLNTLSLSGLILLAINPLNLFDIGFQMTFVAVFGILFFGSLFNKVKIKNKIAKNIFLSVATSLSTQLAMLPLLAKYYGYFSTWSILSNLFTIPLFSIFYTLLFVINLVVLILPFMNFLFVLPKALLNVIIYLNLLVTKLPFSIIKSYPFGFVGTLFYYLTMFAVSKYFIVGVKLKILTSCILLCISLFFIIPSALPNISVKNIMYFVNQEDSAYTTLITTKNNKHYLLNPNFSSKAKINKIKADLSLKKINKLDGILFISNQNFEAVMVKSFVEEYNATLYLPYDNLAITNLKQLNLNIYEFEYNTEYKLDNNLSISYMQYDNNFIASLLNFNNKLYLELDANQITLNQNFLEYANSHLNFLFDCVKINNANINEYSNILNSKQFVLNNTGTFY